MKIRFWAIFLFAFLFLAASGYKAVPAYASDGIYIIGIVDPMNKSETIGHVPFPYFREIMKDILVNSPNNYIVKFITEEDLMDTGYYYSSIRPDFDLSSEQIKRLCLNHKLDAILTANILNINQSMVSRLFDAGGRKIDYKAEGLMYDRDGNKIWSYTTETSKEYVREGDKFTPPQHTQMVNVFIDDTKKMASNLIGKIGGHQLDRQAPVIELTNLKSGDNVKTTCIVLKGKVTDNSKIAKITVNGQEFPLLKPMNEVSMFYPVSISQGIKGQRVNVKITATDIYGYTAEKDIDLIWDKPVDGYVTQTSKNVVSVKISGESFKNTAIGTGFILWNVNQVSDPMSSTRFYTLEKVGPVVVTDKFPSKNIVHVQFFKGSENLIMDVKKGDILK